MDNKIRGYFNNQVLCEAAASFTVTLPELVELDGFENFIYEYQKEGKDYILRISHISRRTPDMIEAEMHWIQYLHQNQVNCSQPLKSNNGHLVEVIGTGENQFVVCAFDKVPGCRVTEELDTKQFRFNYGRQLGRMHRVTRDYQPGNFQRIQWFDDELVRNFGEVVPVDQVEVIRRMTENTQQILSMTPNKDNYGLIHADVHLGNFFVQQDDIFLYDFDDSQYAFFAADIAIVMFYFAGRCPNSRSREDFIREFYQDFMKGYLSEYQLPLDELRKIPIFLKQREIILYAAVLQAYRGVDFDEWANWYMTGRREKIEQGIPFLDMDFC